MEVNNLNGLRSTGFVDNTTAFDESIFDDTKKINKLRSVISTYIRKTKNVNSDSNSTGLKHILQNHLDIHVSIGEVIYAMHLEGFSIARKNENCFFNASSTGVRLLKHANEVKETLQLPYFFNDYYGRKHSYLKYKYTFNSLIECRFAQKAKLKQYVYPILSLELGETTGAIKDWMNIFGSEETEIPEEIKTKLSKVFKLKEEYMLTPTELED